MSYSTEGDLPKKNTMAESVSASRARRNTRNSVRAQQRTATALQAQARALKSMSSGKRKK